MSKNKILFDGCSFTANSGFAPENQNKFHWPHLLSRHYRVDVDNNAVGGSSNTEIFNRTVQNTASDAYNLVVVQWSSINRYWAYRSDNNIDDFTIISGGQPCGFSCDQYETQQYSKLHQTYFTNNYMNLRHWLCQVIALAGFFNYQKQPYVFIKGFENYISDFTNAEYISGVGFVNLPKEIKDLLDFNNRPDDYILSKIINIQNLINKARHLNWLNFDSISFNDAAVDLADDQMHPGLESNQWLSEQLILHCDRKNLLTHV